jgi:hypothetical protein
LGGSFIQTQERSIVVFFKGRERFPEMLILYASKIGMVAECFRFHISVVVFQ